jgi:hypothetical protein
MLKYLLNKETTVIGKIKNVFAGFTFCLLWVTFVKLLINTLYGVPILQIDPAFPPGIPYIFFWGVIAAPLWEEAAYRYFPMKVVQKFGMELLMPVMILSSIIFGWGHGLGFISILIQGVCGFIMNCVYVKNGMSYWSSVSLHAMWNFQVEFGLPYFLN